MKTKKSGRRQLLVLTPEEKRIIAFVLVALVVGVGAKRYREIHAIPPQKTAIVETTKTVAIPAQKRAEAKRRKQAR